MNNIYKRKKNDSVEHLIQLGAIIREDIEVTEEMIKHDEDLMNDDSLWEN